MALGNGEMQLGVEGGRYGGVWGSREEAVQEGSMDEHAHAASEQQTLSTYCVPAQVLGIQEWTRASPCPQGAPRYLGRQKCKRTVTI